MCDHLLYNMYMYVMHAIIVPIISKFIDVDSQLKSIWKRATALDEMVYILALNEMVILIQWQYALLKHDVIQLHASNGNELFFQNLNFDKFY